MSGWRIEGIEVGTADEPRSPVAVGQDVYLAVCAARDEDLVTILSADGREAAALVPLDGYGYPACCRHDMAERVSAGKLADALAEVDRQRKPANGPGSGYVAALEALAMAVRAEIPS